MLRVVGTGEQYEPFRIGNVSFERARFARNHSLAMLRFERRRSRVRKKGSLSKSTDSTSRQVALFMHRQPLGIRRFNGGNNVVDVVSIRRYHRFEKRSSREQTGPSITMIYSDEEKRERERERERWVIGATTVDDRCDNFLFIA